MKDDRSDRMEAKRRAARRAKAKFAFFIHLAVYCIVNVLLFFIDLFSSPGLNWFYWPLMGWGFGLAVHGLVTYGLKYLQTIRERMIRKELEKEDLIDP